MKVLLIPDKFKGSLTAGQAIDAIESGLKQADPSVHIQATRASDGGDGFLDAIADCTRSVRMIECPTSDPLGRPMAASYGYDASHATAYVEMAKASGMVCLKPEERDPLHTSTRGTGLLIAEALRRGAKTIYVGLGGSATNDGGVGIAQALGYRFLDERSHLVEPIGEALTSIASIDASDRLGELHDARVFAINDVTNPLLGPEGAAAVYAPQKGADAAAVAQLERGLDRLQQVVRRDLGIDQAGTPGAGAAGGTGYGLRVFLDAEFLSGIEFVLTLTGIESLLAAGEIDWILTGEGKIDDQTAYGKLVHGVADVGRKYNVPVVALCGTNALLKKTPQDLGLERVIQLHRPDRSVEFTMEHAAELLQHAAERLYRTTLAR